MRSRTRACCWLLMMRELELSGGFTLLFYIGRVVACVSSFVRSYGSPSKCHKRGKLSKENECIWNNGTMNDVRKKVEKFLVKEVPYFQFCDECIGSENEIATT